MRMYAQNERLHSSVRSKCSTRFEPHLPALGFLIKTYHLILMNIYNIFTVHRTHRIKANDLHIWGAKLLRVYRRSYN